MAKPVSFSKPNKVRKGSDTSFNFGFNRLSKSRKTTSRKKAGRGGGS